MKFPARTLLFIVLCGSAQAAPDSRTAPAGVDALSPTDVTKAISDLKESFVSPSALSDADLARATLQGLLDRLAPEATLVSGVSTGQPAVPFYVETYNGRTGYLRPGALTGDAIAKSAQALKDWSARSIGAVILDLRGTPPSSDFQAGAHLAELFCPKGTEMFSLTTKGEASGAPSTQSFTAQSGQIFKGILVVLIDGDTAEASEAVAASLQKCAKALLVGDETAGRAFQYKDFPVSGQILRVAVGQVILTDGKKPGEMPLKPDIEASIGTTPKADLMHSVTASGIASVIQEHDRPHLNEAALVAGNNPEVDELEAEESGKKPAQAIIDRQLQRALDMVTSISIYQAKAARSASTGE